MKTIPHVAEEGSPCETVYEVGDVVCTTGSYNAYYFSLGGLMTQAVTVGDRYDEKHWINKIGIVQEKPPMFLRLAPDHEEYLMVYFPHAGEALYIKREALVRYECIPPPGSSQS